MSITFTLNKTEYWIDEYHGGWAWVNSLDEEQAGFSANPVDAQQDAINHEIKKLEDAEQELADELEDECYGTYRQQVDNLYYSTRL